MEVNDGQAGMILDERYEIKSALEIDADTTFYEGLHQRIQKKVLIQELDLRKNGVEELLFKYRQLGDFSDIPGLCHVLDQFEEAGKAYIIADYPEGISIEQYLKQKKRISEDELTELFLPVIKTLDKLQNADIRSVTVSVKTLYRSKEGKLCMIPEIAEDAEDTDYVYSICEIFYECLSGKKPQEKFVRMLFDETESLEVCDPKGSVSFHKIVEKGMNIDPECGFQTLEELHEELDNWKKENVSQKRNPLYFIAGWAVLGIVVIAILFGLYKKYEENLRFLGIKTETIVLTPSGKMKQKDYINSIELVENQVKKLTGNSKYWVEDEDGRIRIVIPYETYAKTESDEELEEYLTKQLKETQKNEFHINTEIQVNWMDRNSKDFTNWVSQEKIEEPSVKLEYVCHTEKTDEEEKISNLKNLAVRLECLKVPYTIGTAKDDESTLVVRMCQKDCSDFVSDILGVEGGNERLGLYDRWGNHIYAKNLEIKADDNKWKLYFECTAENMEEFLTPVLKDDGNVYLKVNDKYNIAKLHLKETPQGTEIKNNQDTLYYGLSFEEALMCENGKFTEDMKPLAEFLNMLAQDGNMDISYNLGKVQYSSKGDIVADRDESKISWEFNPYEAEMIKNEIQAQETNVEVERPKRISDVLFVSLHMYEENNIKEAAQKIGILWQECNLNESCYDFYFYVDEPGKGLYVNFNRDSVNRKWQVNIGDFSEETDSEETADFIKKLKNIFSQNKYVIFV